MITFDRQAGPLQNLNQSHVMAIGRSEKKILVGKKTRPPPPKIFFLRFTTPGTFLSGILFSG